MHSKNYAVITGILGLMLLVFHSCDLINLAGLTYESNPSQDLEVLSTNESIYIDFADPVDKSTAEQVISVIEQSTGDVVTLDYSWSGNRVILSPWESLKPGYVYSLDLAGSLTMEDKRKFTLSESISFYYGSSATPSILASYSIQDNATVDINTPLVMNFDNPMNQQNFEDNFSISPAANVLYAWSNGSRTVTITPETQWEVITRYTWTVDSEIVDQRGINLPKTYEGHFLVQLDADGPVYQAVGSGTFNQATSTATIVQSDLTAVLYSDVLIFDFDETLTLSSFSDSFTIDPGIDGSFYEAVTTGTTGRMVFIPDQGWDHEQTYRITLNPGLEDFSGNKSIDEYVLSAFTPNITPHSVTSVNLDSGLTNITLISSGGDFNNASLAASVEIDTGLNQDIVFTILYDQVYSSAQFTEIINQISNEPVLSSISNPVLETAIWTGAPADSVELTLTYSGYADTGSLTDLTSKQIFKFTIPGGTTSANSNGSYLPNDTFFYYETY